MHVIHKRKKPFPNFPCLTSHSNHPPPYPTPRKSSHSLSLTPYPSPIRLARLSLRSRVARLTFFRRSIRASLSLSLSLCAGCRKVSNAAAAAAAHTNGERPSCWRACAAAPLTQMQLSYYYTCIYTCSIQRDACARAAPPALGAEK